MDESLESSIIAAAATVAAAILAGVLPLAGMILGKELKVSELRQSWIDGLRADLATFLACARAFARASQELQLGVSQKSEVAAALSFSNEKINDIRYLVAESTYRIKLRLNSTETYHRELLQKMESALELQNRALAGAATTDEVLAAVESVASTAPTVLKTEWARVKRGETPYIVARNILFAIGLVSVVALACVLSVIWANR